MALDRQRQIIGIHAKAVIDDADQRAPAMLQRNVDALRPGIQRILDQLLDGGGRALDHFACGNAVDQDGVEAADRGGHGSGVA